MHHFARLSFLAVAFVTTRRARDPRARHRWGITDHFILVADQLGLADDPGTTHLQLSQFSRKAVSDGPVTMICKPIRSTEHSTSAWGFAHDQIQPFPNGETGVAAPPL